MKRNRLNSTMFALRRPPPQEVELAGRGRYRLVRVFKHDFFAATCLYESVEPADPPRVVVKYARSQPFLGLPTDWLARLMRSRESGVYRALEGVEGVPRYLGAAGRTGYAIEYVDATPLDHLDAPPAGFFDRLRKVMEAIHARGVAYTDANKRSNILVRSDGRPVLVDYQLAFRRRDDWPWPLGALLRRAFEYVADKDIYHVLKHKRRMAPQELTEEERVLSRRRSGLHSLHRKLAKAWRRVRRAFLRSQHRKGALRSPTEELEDHHQPEKATWRDS